MTTLVSQPGLGLTAPSSRQDIISALLNEYGNSFGGDTSPYNNYSPIPALKELPPPPPKDTEKSHPALMMRFQLRGRSFRHLIGDKHPRTRVLPMLSCTVCPLMRIHHVDCCMLFFPFSLFLESFQSVLGGSPHEDGILLTCRFS